MGPAIGVIYSKSLFQEFTWKCLTSCLGLTLISSSYFPSFRFRSSSYVSSKLTLAAAATLTETRNCSSFLPVDLKGNEGFRLYARIWQLMLKFVWEMNSWVILSCAHPLAEWTSMCHEMFPLSPSPADVVCVPQIFSRGYGDIQEQIWKAKGPASGRRRMRCPTTWVEVNSCGTGFRSNVV